VRFNPGCGCCIICVGTCVCTDPVPATLYSTVTLPSNADTDPFSGVSVAMTTTYACSCSSRRRGVTGGGAASGNYVIQRPGDATLCCTLTTGFCNTCPGIFDWNVVINQWNGGLCNLSTSGQPSYTLDVDCGLSARADANSIRCSPFLLVRNNVPLLRCNPDGSTTNLGNATWTISE
jgi:hypothetical protein